MRAALLSVSSAIVLGALLYQGCSSPARRTATFKEIDAAIDPTLAADGGDAGPAGPSLGGTEMAEKLDASENKCSTTNVQFALSAVYLQFIVDRSGSMSGTKWAALQGALKEVYKQIYNDVDVSVGVGLVLFPSSTNVYPEQGKDVFIGYVDQPQLNKLNARTNEMVLGATPTLQAMQGAYPILKNLVPIQPLVPGGKKVAVVMTDGQPNDGYEPNPDGGAPLQHDQADLARKALETDGITTFAVGVGNLGSDVSPVFLGTLAVAGGTADLSKCNPYEETDLTKMCHFHIVPGSKTAPELRDEFIAAINQIRRAAAGCEYNLQEDLSADPQKVNVKITVTDRTGKATEDEISKDPDQGWSFDDDLTPKKIILHGKSCETATKELNVKVEVLFGCRTKSG